MEGIEESEPSVVFDFFLKKIYIKTDSFQCKLFVKTKTYSLGPEFLYASKVRKNALLKPH